MKDGRDTILYVGKAKNLRNRLSSYFQPGLSPRIELLIRQIDHFDVILTETESEALILECTLIKRHKPKFNIRLKDDKAYPHIRVQMDEEAPRLEWTRRVCRDNARYFGPFPSASAARQVIRLLNETLKLRDCSDNTYRHRSRACSLFQMKKCSAPCVRKEILGEYREAVQDAMAVLEGQADRLMGSLTRGMEDASKREEYELAAEYRDQMKSLQAVTELQGVVEAGVDRDRDVVGIARNESIGHGILLQIRNGKMVAVRHYHLQNTDMDQPMAELLFDFLSQYYLTMESPESRGAREVLVPDLPADLELLERAIQVQFRVSEKDTDERLLAVARNNAQYGLDSAGKRNLGHGAQALEEIQKKLHLAKIPGRIECYDISNIQGTDAVGSRVVFVDGVADKSLYRRYKIRESGEGDPYSDFAMLREVLRRRLTHLEDALPDLLVVDGGKGQLTQALAILEELEVQGVDVVGLAKARVESDFQSPEVKSSLERVFIPNRKNPVPLLPHTASYRLLTHIRDEAHRFAVSYHRHLRGQIK